MTKRAAAQSVNMLRAQIPEAAEIDREQRQDGAELDQNGERLAEGIVARAEKALHQQQMAGRGDRQVFGQPLDDAEHGRFDQVDIRRDQTGRLHGVKGMGGVLRKGRLVAAEAGNCQGQRFWRKAATQAN